MCFNLILENLFVSTNVHVEKRNAHKQSFNLILENLFVSTSRARGTGRRIVGFNLILENLFVSTYDQVKKWVHQYEVSISYLRIFSFQPANRYGPQSGIFEVSISYLRIFSFQLQTAPRQHLHHGGFNLILENLFVSTIQGGPRC